VRSEREGDAEGGREQDVKGSGEGKDATKLEAQTPRPIHAKTAATAVRAPEPASEPGASPAVHDSKPARASQTKVTAVTDAPIMKLVQGATPHTASSTPHPASSASSSSTGPEEAIGIRSGASRISDSESDGHILGHASTARKHTSTPHLRAAGNDGDTAASTRRVPSSLSGQDDGIQDDHADRDHHLSPEMGEGVAKREIGAREIARQQEKTEAVFLEHWDTFFSATLAFFNYIWMPLLSRFSDSFPIFCVQIFLILLSIRHCLQSHCLESNASCG